MSNQSRTRAVWAGLAACAVVALLHQAMHWSWFIDDAAISFAYARNWAAGEGLVAVPGGERIEGYSNPTWVVLLTMFELIGLSGFVIAKPMAGLFSVGCLVLVYRIACQALPGRTIAPLLAPFTLAMSAQFALWSTSALENSLFCFLLALGIDRVLIERQRGGVPWSSVAFLGLAWTRPEGLLYAALGGAWFLVFTLRAGRGIKPVAAWVTMFWVPYGLLEALRLHYFAWPLANTYYAKVGVQGSYPLSWYHRGWMQARDYADRLWHGWMLPIYFLGLFGTRGRRAAFAAVACIGLALLLIYPGPERLAGLPFWPRHLPLPPWFLVGRIGVLGALGALLPFVALGRPGADARAITWHMAACSVFFAVYANGDWMGGYRWMSLLAPTASVLFAVGVVELADFVEERVTAQSTWTTAGWSTAWLGAALLLPPNMNQTRDHAYFNHDETPQIVKRRADYTTSVARAAFYEGEVVNLEMDQGAHLWWYPHYREVDMAGLVDIPMSRHRYNQRRFIQEYVFDERQPTFGHVHGGWAKNSGFKTYDDWAPTYFELPRYHDKELGWHDGVWARRDLFVRSSYDSDADRQVGFGGGAELVGLDVPVAEWAPGQEGFVELALRTLPRGPDEAFRVILFLSQGDWLHSVEVEPGVGLYPMHEWDPDDIYVGGFTVPVPDDAPTGPMELGILLLDAAGRVLPAGGHDGRKAVATDALVDGPRMARGEVRFADLVAVTDGDHAARAAQAVADVRDYASSEQCEEAEAAWVRAKRHRPRAWAWHDAQLASVGPWLAACWARAAEHDAEQGVTLLARAHRWDHHHEALARVGAPIGQALWQEGTTAREQGDHERAYRAFTQLLSFQPWRSWARRYAEEARDARLDLAGLERR